MSFKNYVMYDLFVLCHAMQYDLCLLFELRLICNGVKDKKKNHVIGPNGPKGKKETY
jgi:hypothetical protein